MENSFWEEHSKLLAGLAAIATVVSAGVAAFVAFRDHSDNGDHPQTPDARAPIGSRDASTKGNCKYEPGRPEDGQGARLLEMLKTHGFPSPESKKQFAMAAYSRALFDKHLNEVPNGKYVQEEHDGDVYMLMAGAPRTVAIEHLKCLTTCREYTFTIATREGREVKTSGDMCVDPFGKWVYKGEIEKQAGEQP